MFDIFENHLKISCYMVASYKLLVTFRESDLLQLHITFSKKKQLVANILLDYTIEVSYI